MQKLIDNIFLQELLQKTNDELITDETEFSPKQQQLKIRITKLEQVLHAAKILIEKEQDKQGEDLESPYLRALQSAVSQLD